MTDPTEMRRSGRRGFSLIEVMIAVALLAIVALSMGKISPVMAQKGRLTDVRAAKAFLMQQQAERLMGTRWGKIDSGYVTQGSKTFTVQGYTLTRTITIHTGTKEDTVWLVVTPSITNGGTSLNKPDTMVIIRGRGNYDPLCTLSTC